MADPTIVMNFEKDPNIGIYKKVLHAGKGEVPDYMNGTKVRNATLFYDHLFSTAVFLWVQNESLSNSLSVC